MKRFFSILVFLLGYNVICAQISIRDNNTVDTNISNVLPYDSLTNFNINYDIIDKEYATEDEAYLNLKSQFEIYKGQDIFILPLTQRDLKLNLEYKNNKLRGKYYTIIDINFNLEERYNGYYKFDKLIFQLKDSKGNKAKWEVPYYSLNESLLVGYYEKLKKSCINNKFIYTGRAKGKGSQFIKEPKLDHSSIDTKTNDVVTLYVGQEWHCSDIQLVDDDFSMQLYAVMSNNEGAEILARLENRFKTKAEKNVAFFSCFMLNTEYLIWKNQIIKSYGEEYGNMILQKKVKIGMTKEMCSESWGTPSDINTTTLNGQTSEQWVYENDSYLYFDNGILTAVQN